MKKLFLFGLLASFMLMASTSANAQTRVEDLKDQRFSRLTTNVQAFVTEDGEVLKKADAEGLGLELFAGYHYALWDKYHTPELGLSLRYDMRKISFRVSGAALTRQYNFEDLNAGKRYMTYAADAYFHVNLLNRKRHVNVLNLFINGGYLFCRHHTLINGKELRAGGSGVTYGGGLEYRCQFFATGHALCARIGYKSMPQLFVGRTKIHGSVYAQLGWNFGLARNRK